MSYVQLTYHVVFSTHARKPTISEEYDKELYAYLNGTVNKLGGLVRAIGGKPDHVHLLLDLPATLPIADYMKKLKQSSSAWLRANKHFPYWERWSSGYSVFTCSPHPLERVINYVNNQKSRHHKMTFDEEMKAVFDHLGMAYDKRMLR